MKPKVKGINTAYLYVGMWRSTFGIHSEDNDLYSINLLHFGEPKSWYVVPPKYADDLEQLVQTLLPEQHKKCQAFLR